MTESKKCLLRKRDDTSRDQYCRRREHGLGNRQSRIGLNYEDHFKDIGYPWVDRIAQSLHPMPPGSPGHQMWKDVAWELGFQLNDLEQFEEQCHLSEIVVNPAKLMLEEWMIRDGSTIRVLKNVATRLKLDDIVKVIETGIIGMANDLIITYNGFNQVALFVK